MAANDCEPVKQISGFRVIGNETCITFNLKAVVLPVEKLLEQDVLKMNVKKKQIVISALALCGAAAFSQNARAEGDVVPFVGVNAGTSGFGLQGGFQLRPDLSVRLVLNNLTVDYSMEVDGVDYELDSDIELPQLLVDYHPFDNGFYFSGGLTRNTSQMGGLATLSEAAQIGTVTVQPEDVGGLRAKADYDDIAPYVGLGWRSGMQGGFAWQFEFGVSAMKDPSVTLVEEGSNFVAQSDLDAEAASIEKDLEDEFVAYPHLRLGIQYRF